MRFVTTGSGTCEIDVDEVQLSASGDDNFDNTVNQLKAQGYDDSDRKYLIYVDTTSAGICGIGTYWLDDSPGQANWNNYGPSYARVDAGCWNNGKTPAHEIMHNLGAVQPSAPHATNYGHCIDEWDVMCYSDNASSPPMQYLCLPQSHDSRFDCNHDDYFHTSPAAGNYLADNWNAANNRFLVGGGDGPSDDGQPPTVNWVAPLGNTQTYTVSQGMITLEATASDGSGINHVEFNRKHPQLRRLGHRRRGPHRALHRGA